MALIAVLKGRFMRVISVFAIGSASLLCSFDDGKVGIVDLGDLVAQEDDCLTPLRDPSFFANVMPWKGRAIWPNFFSLCPQFLWARMRTLEHKDS
jgi:hypothetical protein